MRTMQVLCNVFVAASIVFSGLTLIAYPLTNKQVSTESTFSEVKVEKVNLVYAPPPPAAPKPVEKLTPVKSKVKYSAKDIECMALNIYHEARGESQKGKEAVAWVTLNRVNHSSYPNTVCGVVKQARYSQWFKEVKGKNVPLKNQCHFSWYCDGRDDEPRDMKQWNISVATAKDIMYNYNTYTDPTRGAIMYHADYVKPYWRTHYQKLVKIDTHIFYGEKQV